MEAGGRPSSSRVVVPTKRRLDILLQAAGLEAAARAVLSHIRRAKKPPWRRTAQIRCRRAKKTNLSLLSTPRSSNLLHRPKLSEKHDAVYRAQIIPSRRRRGLDDCLDCELSKRTRCPPPTDSRGDLANLDDDGSRLTDLPCPPANTNWRDWANLDDGPAGLIAERVLAYDVAGYVRFRAVCRQWRQSSTEPRRHSGLDRRFHPWRWTMLREELALPDRRCFLNTSTGQCVQVDIPELRDHELLADTPEGLLVLVHDRKHIRLLNPLTRHLTELPPITTLLPPTTDSRRLLEQNPHFISYFAAWGSGVADDSTFVLCFSRLSMIGIAKPGDESWTLLQYNCGGLTTAPLMFAGRFYCVTRNAVMVLDTDPDLLPHLKVAAKLKNMGGISPMADSLHLVNNFGELMLVHRHRGPLTPLNKSGRCYDTYQVDLDTGTLLPVKTLGGAGRAIFMGMHFSLSLSQEVFPSGSITADSIYLSFDFSERDLSKVGAYHLADGSIQLPSSSVPRPYTLVDCLSLSSTVVDDS